MRDAGYLGQLHSYTGLWRKPPDCRFIIFTQGRAGSTLLKTLLNSHPSIRCDTGILDKQLFGRIAAPQMFIEGRSRIQGRSRRIRRPVYGFPLHQTHLTDDQGIVDPARFFRRMHRRQWKLIHLIRNNIFKQTLSKLIAKETGVWHRKSDQVAPPSGTVSIDSDQLIQEMRWRAEHVRRERQLLKEIPHLLLVYERDLLTRDQHQPTADKVFDFLGLPRHRVRTKLQRTGRDDLSELVANYAQILDHVAESGVAQDLGIDSADCDSATIP